MFAHGFSAQRPRNGLATRLVPARALHCLHCPIDAAIIPNLSPTCVLPRADSDCDHDSALLAAALEEIEARRAAIEWLLDADLLCRCLA